jgi:hypothetical protein
MKLRQQGSPRMKGNLSRRIEWLKQRDDKGKDIIVFWSGPEEDGKVTEAQKLSHDSGRPLLIIK